MREDLNQLRAELNQVREELIEAEARLADRLAEINAFEVVVEAQIGPLIDQLEVLEREIRRYHERIHLTRHRDSLGNVYLPVQEQYRRTWEQPDRTAPQPPPASLPPQDETQIKQLYRRLARRFHPDLAGDEAERTRRTQKMKLINDAYASRSLVELIALTQEADTLVDHETTFHRTEVQLIQALEAELVRCRRRLREIEQEIRHLAYRSSVELSLEVKAARQQGRDLLAELAAELERKLARKTVERDMLKTQFDQLGPEHGFIPTGKG